MRWLLAALHLRISNTPDADCFHHLVYWSPGRLDGSIRRLHFAQIPSRITRNRWSPWNLIQLQTIRFVEEHYDKKSTPAV